MISHHFIVGLASHAACGGKKCIDFVFCGFAAFLIWPAVSSLRSDGPPFF